MKQNHLATANGRCASWWAALSFASVLSCVSHPPLDRACGSVDVLAGYQQITNQDEGDASGGQVSASMTWPLGSGPFDLGFMLAYGHDSIRLEEPGGRENLDLTEALLGPFARVNLPLSSAIIPFLDVSAGAAYVHHSEGVDLEEVLGTDALDHSFTSFAQVGAGTRFFLTERFALEVVARYRLLGGLASNDSGTVEGFAVLMGISVQF